MKKSIMILSGGQDSVTCLYNQLAQKETSIQAALFFNYGQKHLTKEKESAKYHTKSIGIPFYEIPVMGFGSVAESALINHNINISSSHPQLQNLPASFVPGRNLMFLVFAAAFAMKLNATSLITGVCQTDYSGYPDCRRETIDAMENALRLGMEYPELEIITPLMHLTKDETFYMAWQGGYLDKIIANTHTGYNGVAEILYCWGWGPQDLQNLDPASQLRRDGFHKFYRNMSDVPGFVEEIAKISKEDLPC